MTYGSEAVWTCHVQKNLYYLSDDVTPDGKAFGFYSVRALQYMCKEIYMGCTEGGLSMRGSAVCLILWQGFVYIAFKGTVLLLTRCFGMRWFVLEIHGSCYEKFHGLTYINLGMGTQCSVSTYSGNTEMKPGTHPRMKKKQFHIKLLTSSYLDYPEYLGHDFRKEESLLRFSNINFWHFEPHKWSSFIISEKRQMSLKLISPNVTKSFKKKERNSSTFQRKISIFDFEVNCPFKSYLWLSSAVFCRL